MDRRVTRYAGIFGGASGDSFMIFMTDDRGNDGGAMVGLLPGAEMSALKIRRL